MRLIIGFLLVAGIASQIAMTRTNRTLRHDVRQLEAELGRMPIDDADQVHIVAIAEPRIPPEVEPYVDRVWQFRCYLPAGYDFERMGGGGRVSDRGLYFQGGYGTSRSMPDPEPHHQLLTISLHQKANHTVCFIAFGGSSSTTSWDGMTETHLDGRDWVVETLATPGKPARKFDQDTILPLLKVYDPHTAEEKEIDGQSITTYAGGIIVLCPSSLEAEFRQLRKGETPENFKQSWIAEGLRQ